MHPLVIVLIVLLSIVALLFLITFICFRLTFYNTKKQKIVKEFDLPPDKIYEPYHKQMLEWMKESKTFSCEKIEIKSFDGLTLRGKYYEHQKGTPIEIMFHGYRGSSERDLCGGIQRCLSLKRNVLIVDQRAHASSDGHVITFGIKERFDCVSWANYAYERFGKDVKLIITGISMGASTVLLASELPLPETVVGVVADCGYSSPKEIIKSTIRKMHLPARIFYPFVKLGAKIFGKFNIEERTPLDAVKNTSLPIVFIHGDNDDFVPYEMSVKMYNACKNEKKLITAKGAGHGMAYLIDPDEYIRQLEEFEKAHY